ncbi:phosphatase PAP2 family protein [Kineosporia sp. J2-2]|uniref:Phosphatase PAP2 family protein n=1 Tax=Kineosporia corallincola TaxID=2835133 RepID=A0ABS5TK37_9ACTN|nr:phosphatase PAP2 family protein [Kineosporia corallincola]MBT0771466.1 phosphatase PAP2 family protein [Kineosporia corallincola]
MTRSWTARWLAGWAVLIGLTLLVVAGASLTVDDATLGWFTVLDRPGAGHLVWRTLVMGGQFWLVGTAAAVIGLARSWWSRSWHPFLVTAVAVVTLDVLLLTSKHLAGRTSPHSGLNEVLVGGSSYPSGHTANATMCLALIAVLLTGAAGRARRRALAAAVLMAVVVGICNLVLGYHWISEVVAGWLLGALVVLGAARLLDRT